MKTIHKSVLIWYTPQQMLDLVVAVDRYPEFLPWCGHAAILQRESETVFEAEIGMQFAGLRQSFATRNTITPGRALHMALLRGPFTDLQGVWLFEPLEAEPQACRVTLDLRYSFSPLLSAVVGPVFDKIANSLMDAFVQRAEALYG